MAGAATSERFTAGARVGDYHIEREVAEDTTGIIYLATHVVLPRQSHLKVVSRVGARSEAVQLLREACILEALSHPGIPRVYECGVLGDRRPWSAIEPIAGVTFEQLTSAGSLAVPDLVVAMREVADILRHAHDRGVVHAGLTPAVIVRTLRRRGLYAIGDWSCARTHDTQSDVAIDPRDDVFALGALTFQALAGQEPIPGGSAATFCPAAPIELTAVIDQMLAEPVLRPTANEVFDRALWLCDLLEVSPLLERGRWTPPRGYVTEGVPRKPGLEDQGGFAVRISRPRSS
jgi:serine/threonine protein kinase